MKTRAILPNRTSWVRRQVKTLTRGARQFERWLCPNPEAFWGMQPALADGPSRAHINFMVSESNGGSGKATLTRKEELVSLLQEYKYKDIELVEKAFALAKSLPIEQTEKNRRVAHQLVTLRASACTIASAMLIGVNAKSIKHPKLQEILANRTRLNSFSCDYARKDQVDMFRSLLFLSAKSQETLLLLAAEDLVELQEFHKGQSRALDMFKTLALDEARVEASAKRAFFVTSWILKYLEFSKVGGELQDLALLHLEPKKYHEVEARLNEELGMSRVESMSRLRELADNLHSLLERNNHPGRILYRVKHIASTAKKIEKKGESQDVNGLRIILDSKDGADCYWVLQELRSFFTNTLSWSELSQEYDDYVSAPKKNGYQSIHAVFQSPHGYAVEVQLRTKDMDEVAEFGSASHGSYKTGDKIITGITDLSVPIAQQRFAIKKLRIEQAGVTFVYDNKNNLIGLRTGSEKVAPTLLDMAFAVDWRVGLRIKAGKIDGKRALIGAELKPGQKIITEASIAQGPKVHGRLKKVRTHFARAILSAFAKGKIDSAATSLDETVLIARGKNIYKKFRQGVEAELAPYHRYLSGETTFMVSMERLMNRLAFKNEDEFYLTLGLLSDKEPLLSEVKKYLEQNLLLASFQQQGWEATMELITNTAQQGVCAKILSLMNNRSVNLIASEHAPIRGAKYSLVKAKMRANKPQIEEFKADLEDLYLGLPPIQAQHGSIIKLRTKVAQNSFPLPEVLAAISRINANIKASAIPEAKKQRDLFYEFTIQLPQGISKKKASERLGVLLENIRGVSTINILS